MAHASWRSTARTSFVTIAAPSARRRRASARGACRAPRRSATSAGACGGRRAGGTRAGAARRSPGTTRPRPDRARATAAPSTGARPRRRSGPTRSLRTPARRRLPAPHAALGRVRLRDEHDEFSALEPLDLALDIAVGIRSEVGPTGSNGGHDVVELDGLALAMEPGDGVQGEGRDATGLGGAGLGHGLLYYYKP